MSGYELHVITTGGQDWDTVTSIVAHIWPYVTALHIREKKRNIEDITQGIQRLLDAGVPPEKLYLNGHPSLVSEMRLGGVHLPGDSELSSIVRSYAPRLKRVGCSVHSPEEARSRAVEGADYVLFGHIYSTSSKQGLAPRGLEALRETAAGCTAPVIAIGGIQPERVGEVLTAGAAGVAVMSGIMEAKNPVDAVQRFAAVLGRSDACD
ncbi:thiamine phosphate synthase [Paenibacillus hexagrammi]|uniref:Thiamine phosphate synthase n=1 Tax=Paenibacillus hexagrammi TaxID=2908839 RepID=A0ABY3SLP8_9BACL|nr:thiamine phosphate synthase [Paenibacillus sp. YPD9-1]UJF34116.1 thiamine phosphate synthase [Paenibacillus sp. YPD9-1]